MTPQLISQLLQFIAGLATLIILHEFGHFLVARFFKVEIEEFGIGFPPRIVKLFEVKGTEFTLNWIPLGGFVRPKGENDPSVPGGLAAANPWVRLAVSFAGPAMNLLVGLVLAVGLFYSEGNPVLDKVKIEKVVLNSPAASAGLQSGDLIVAINGNQVDSFESLQSLVEANLNKPTELTYQRGDQVASVTLTPRMFPPPNEGAMGIVLGHPIVPISIGGAISRGAQATYDYARGVILLPVRILQGQASPQEGRPVGFKGMFDIYQQFQSPVLFFILITLSLGVFNLFPIPALDGGRILLTLPEIILRRRIPPRYENMLHLVGFMLLLILIIYINIQDFVNPLSFPK